jgi:hypothetical protein
MFGKETYCGAPKSISGPNFSASRCSSDNQQRQGITTMQPACIFGIDGLIISAAE